MRCKWRVTLVLLGCLAGPVVGRTAEAQLVNGDFESGSYSFDSNNVDSLALGSTNITGWTTLNAELAVINQPNNFALLAQSGTKHLDLTGYHDSTPYAGIQQTVNTLPGQTYVLQFYVGSSGGGTSSVAVDTGSGPTTFSNTGSSFWQQSTDIFTATGPTTLIKFTGTAASGGGRYLGLDNVTLALATPEPGPLALFIGLGMTSLGALIRKRRLPILKSD